MSDTEDDKTGVKIEVIKLRGMDDYVKWKRSMKAMLASQNLHTYLKKEPSDILKVKLERITMSNIPTPSEINKKTELVEKCETNATRAASLIYNSLSTTVRNQVPDDKIDW